MSKWTRPPSVPFPSIWTTFEGKIVTNGKKRTYWIQDITDEYKDQIVEYMVQGFTNDEPLTKYTETYKLKDKLDGLKKMWEETIDQHLGLVCLTNDENGKPTIAAMNITTVCSKYDQKESSEGQSAPLQILMYMKDQVDVFQELNITEYLDAMGLYVPRKYRGEGLGLALLKAREPLCRACGLKASLTIFTSIISQKLAERAGFKDLYAIDYAELEKRNLNFTYPGIEEHTKTIRFMYILYE